MSLRRGADYLAALRDGRDVWLQGRKVEDVGSHPQLAPFATALAETFDLQHEPEHRELLTTTSPTSGEPVSMGHQFPRSTADLVRQRHMFEFLERRCGGVLGRFPQYMGAVLVGLYNLRHRLASVAPEFAANVEHYLEYCRERDLYLTLGFADPPRNRALDASTMDYLKVVDRRPDGIVIRGAKAVATAAPYADEYLGLSSPRPDHAPDEILYFGIPVATKGLRFVCRESFAQASKADHPLSSSYDEIDSWALFEDVFVPRERIFLLGDPDLNRAIFHDITASWGYYYGLIRVTVKAEALAGICFAVADYLGTGQAAPTQDLLAAAVTHLETMRTIIRAAEEHPIFTCHGLAQPDPLQIKLGRIISLQQHPQILDGVRQLCASSILMAPGEIDLDSPDVGPALNRYIAGSDPRARERFRMMRLAWDYIGDSFGQRQLLFEMLNAQSLASNKAHLLNSYDPAPLVSLAKRLTGIAG